MSRFLGGPLNGTMLELAATPKFLRAVYSTSKDQFDALDQIGDSAAVDEAIFVYKRDGEPMATMFDGTDKAGRRKGWRVLTADYVYLDLERTAANALRDTDAWLNWCALKGVH